MKTTLALIALLAMSCSPNSKKSETSSSSRRPYSAFVVAEVLNAKPGQRFDYEVTPLRSEGRRPAIYSGKSRKFSASMSEGTYQLRYRKYGLKSGDGWSEANAFIIRRPEKSRLRAQRIPSSEDVRIEITY